MVIFVFALGMRLLFSVVYPHLGLNLGAGDGYDQIAASLVNGDGFRLDAGTESVERLPLYPLALASLRVVFGTADWPWQVMQSLLGAWSCVIVFRLASRLASRAGAIAAALFCAVHPGLLLYAARPFTEVPYGFLLLWQVEVIVARRWTQAGLSWGALLLTKSVAWIHVVLLPLIAWRNSGRAAARVMVVALLALLPWLAYQFASNGSVAASSMAGRALYQGLYVSRHVSWTTPSGDLVIDAEREMDAELAARGIAADADAALRVGTAGALAHQWISAHPTAALRLWARNLVLTWYLGRSRLSMALYAVLHGALLVAAGLGLKRAGGANESRLVAGACVLLITAYTAVHAAIHPGVRYILPILPLTAVLAAAAWRSLPKEEHRR